MINKNKGFSDKGTLGTSRGHALRGASGDMGDTPL